MYQGWKIDSVTTLVKKPNGSFFFVWAGAKFPAKNSLEKIAEGALLAQCREAIKTPGREVEILSGSNSTAVQWA